MSIAETALVKTIRSISPATVHEFEKVCLMSAPITFLDLSCSRCGALVNPANHAQHLEWHQDLALGLFFAVSWRATL